MYPGIVPTKELLGRRERKGNGSSLMRDWKKLLGHLEVTVVNYEIFGSVIVHLCHNNESGCDFKKLLTEKREKTSVYPKDTKRRNLPFLPFCRHRWRELICHHNFSFGVVTISFCLYCLFCMSINQARSTHLCCCVVNAHR